VPNARSYTTLINLCVQAAAAGAGSEAIQQGITVIDMMGDAGVAPDVVVYNSLIDATAKAAWARNGGGLVLALEILEKMKKAGVRPDTVTYTSVINSARHEGSEQAVTLAGAIFEKLPKAAR
jgi:hypothetical protein